MFLNCEQSEVVFLREFVSETIESGIQRLTYLECLSFDPLDRAQPEFKGGAEDPLRLLEEGLEEQLLRRILSPNQLLTRLTRGSPAGGGANSRCNPESRCRSRMAFSRSSRETLMALMRCENGATQSGRPHPARDSLCRSSQ